MSPKPLVSFLIALFNKEKYILDCIESCLNQDYCNVEVCIVDDGSTDSSLNIVNENYSDNCMVKTYSFSKNKGKVAAYNKAYELSSGEYFAFVGADDVNIKCRVSSLLSGLLRTNSDLVYGNLLQTDESLNIVKRFDGITNKISYKRIIRNNFISGGSSLFNLKLAEKVFPIPETIKYEDWWISLFAVLSYKVSFVEVDVCLYRLNESNDNLVSSENILLKIENNKKLYKRDFLIYKLLEDYIFESEGLNFNKLDIGRYVLLNRVYKKNYIEKDFFKRVCNFRSIDFFILDRWYLETLFVTFFGSGYDFCVKKIKKLKI